MIEINNLTSNFIDEEFLKEVAKKILERENKKEMDLSIALIGEGRMRKLNKKYCGKNRVTDVLAFPELKVSNQKKEFVYPPQKMLKLGEVIICLPRAKKQAKILKHSLERELEILLTHGILHLLGYNHERSKEEVRKME